MNHFWRLSEAGPDNLGLACTDDGLLLGHTSLIERRGDRFIARDRSEIERLLKRAYHGEPPVDRLMSGLATVASALNANDQCLARIAAVHLEIPDLPSVAARDAMAAEDSLIKYGDANWNLNMSSTAAGWWANGRLLQRRSSAARRRVYQRFYQRLASGAVRLRPARWRQKEQVRQAQSFPLSPKSKPILASAD
jgi:hypothetical protein